MLRNSNKMKDSKHLLFLIAVIITGRADVVPERTRRDSNQVIFDDYGLAAPAVGSGFGNQFTTATQASALAEVQAGKTTENGETAQADATAQTKLQAQFEQEAQHGAETQADAIIHETQGDQYYKGTKVHYYETKKPYNSIMPLEQLIHLPGSENFIGVRPERQYALFPPTDPIIHTGIYHYWNPYNKPAEAETLVQAKEGENIEANALEEINSGSLNKHIGSIFYNTDDNGIHNGGSLYGEALQANEKSHLQSEVPFGGPVGAEAGAQTGSVVETRFGQSAHPRRRPMQGFGYRKPYNRNRG